MTMEYGDLPTGIPTTAYVRVGGTLIESSSMSKTVRASITDHTLKARFFKETGSILPPPPPSGSGFASASTYDPISQSGAWYLSGSPLLGKNSGSNEWNNVTPACAYVARETAMDWQAWDNITSYSRPTYTWITTSYVSGTRPEDSPSRGYRYWSSSLYPYVSHNNFVGLKLYDAPRYSGSLYPTNSLIISESNFTGGFQQGTGSGYGWNYGGYWSGSWIGRSNYWGIQGYESVPSSSYATNSFVNGLSGSTVYQWNAFASSSWTGSTPYRGIWAYENISTSSYTASLEVNGSSSFASDSRYLGFGSSSWIGKTL